MGSGKGHTGPIQLSSSLALGQQLNSVSAGVKVCGVGVANIPLSVFMG